MDKIKSKTYIDKSTILFLFIIVGVGISSFALGRLSVDNDFGQKLELGASSISPNKLILDENIREDKNPLTNEESKEKRYVASKNGRMYYPLGCASAKRIKPENEVWFSSESDALKSGYIKSSMCK